MEINIDALRQSLLDRVVEPQDSTPKVSVKVPYSAMELTDDQLGAVADALSFRADDVPVAQEAESQQKSPPPGYKLDTGKARWDLFPWDGAEEVTKVLTWAIDKKLRGEKAYPERNWERGMAWSRVWGAMIRHGWKWWMSKLKGEDGTDPESGLSHAAHFSCCALMLLSYEVRSMEQYDDRPAKLW
jgi:hypothetical protein